MKQRLPFLQNLLLTAGLVVCALPIWWVLWFMCTSAITSSAELSGTIGGVLAGRATETNWSLLPAFPTLAPLVELLLDTPEFFKMYWNSFTLVLPSILGQFLIGTPAAWALSRLRFRGRGLVYTLYLVLMLMPFQVTMVPNYLVAMNLGLMDTIWAVILPFAFSAFPVFIMARGFAAVPRALLEAASIDGAGHLRTFVRVGLPLGVPAILSALVLGFLECWNAIEQPMTFLKSPELLPLSLYLSDISTQNLALAMAASLMMLLPAALVFLFGQKYLELGIQAVGLKE